MPNNFEKLPVHLHHESSQILTPPFPDVPATPAVSVSVASLADVQPSIVDPYIRESVQRYTEWLQLNNTLPSSLEALRAYQEAALEIKKVGKHTVCTFAPFHEQTSALQVITSRQLVLLVILCVCWIAGLLLLHLALFTISLGVITLLYIIGFISGGLLATRSFSRHSQEKMNDEIIAALDQAGVEWPTYTILCPLYKETAIVPQLVEAMKALDYPAEKLQVLFLTEEHDRETRDTLSSLALPPDFTILTVPEGTPRTKPRACNFGLLQAKGQFTVIFDAEDKPEPSQLKKAVLAFADHGPEVACVQAKLNCYNTGQNLLTRWFTAEYSTWFDIMLPGLQSSGFALPLGGTSNHFRTNVLRALGGWDAFNVTEDCDLGLRIAQFGLQTAMLDSTTYEEAPSRLKPWLLQRSRWIKGYLQTYLVHTRHMKHQRHPLPTLRQGHRRKFFSLQLIVGGWTVVLFINPLMWALTLFYMVFHPVQLYSTLFPGPTLYTGAFCLILGNFFYIYIHLLGCLRRQEYALIKWGMLLPLYWAMMSVSAYIAFYQLLVKPHHWEKTPHGGHLTVAERAQTRIISSALALDKRAIVASLPTMPLLEVTPDPILKRAVSAHINPIQMTAQRVATLRGTLSASLVERNVRRRMRLPRVQDRWLIFTISLAFVFSLAATIYVFQHHLTLIDSDANSHMEIARRLLDNATPGLAQLGGVWLPLPHLLIALFAWNDTLWATGLAGSIVGMGCYVATAIYIFLSARRLTHNSCASFTGTLVFMLNPNVLYLQATPLTEPVCWATMTAACYYLLAWAQEDRKKYLVLAAASTFLATLARYDGWFIFAAFVVVLPVTGLLKHHPLRKIEGQLAVFMALGGLGILLWFVWGQIIFGDPLYFQNGPYSAHQQAIDIATGSSNMLYHNLPHALWLYTVDTVETLGFWLSLLALAALLAFLLKRWKLLDTLATLTLLAPFAFYIIALYGNQVPVGSFATFHPLGIIPASEQNSLFNARFGSEMVAPLAVFIATLVPNWPRMAPFRRRFGGLLGRILIILVIVLQSGWIAYGGVIAMLGSTTPSFCVVGYPIDVYLSQHYNGGHILQSDYPFRISEAQVGIDFSNVIYAGSGSLWTQALQHPQTSVDWMIFQPGDSVAKDMGNLGAVFQRNFTLVVAGPYGLRLYHRNGQQPLPTRPITSYLLSERQSCAPGNSQQVV